ncbi:RNA methyltransferase [Polaribacter sp. MED152]|uniref:TrmH family RNA methyltransferase n=1 Tax=Polaribacter sp. MED152 TaxID=313598 RepID=UPI000068C7F7|nr:RNA methyltransferase [Polaribacter sp. MED152]EAQ41510.1 SpoU rRNA methylase family protein [Polaribacter sp. MED152]
MFVFMVDKKLLEYLEGFLTDKRKQTFQKVLAERTRHFTVVLEDIYQPHNASAVVRTCDIFGVQDLHVIENRYINRVSKYVTKGAQKWITTKRYKTDGDNTKTCLNHLKTAGYQIIATSPHADANLLQDFKIDKKTAFVFGAEATGISDTVKEHADGFLKIPMVGFTESFNISVAAAIILQDVTTRLKNSRIDWMLSNDEKEQLYLQWIKETIKNVTKIEERFYQQLEDE